MKRDKNQTKFVLTSDQMEVLHMALEDAMRYRDLLANEEGRFVESYRSGSHRLMADDYRELLSFAPEVIRVAVTVEVPEIQLAAV